MVDSNQSFLESIEELKKDLNLEQVLVQYLPSIYSFKSMLREFRFGMSLLSNPKLILKQITENKGIELKSELAEIIVSSLKK